jgi:hypothetical protein
MTNETRNHGKHNKGPYVVYTTATALRKMLSYTSFQFLPVVCHNSYVKSPRMFENKVVTKIFGHNMNEVQGITQRQLRD